MLPTFEKFFEIVNGFTPHPWQCQMQQMMSNNQWHAVLDLPTGAGKTQVMVIWFYSLLESLYKQTNHIPYYFHYVVQRKSIIDQSVGLSQKLHDRLNTPELSFAKELLHQKLKVDSPLSISRMHSSIAREDRRTWIKNPCQPTIVLTTVDQYGSGILFRPYGCSYKLAPMQASLSLVNSLIFNDESHLTPHAVKNFQHMLNEANKMNAIANIPPSRLMISTATNAFSDDVYPLTKPKPVTRTFKLLKASGKTNEDKAAYLVDHINSAIASCNLPPLCAIICNTVGLAQAVFKKLHYDKLLLTSRCRGYERKINENKLMAYCGSNRPHLDKPLVVVSTQVIEAGIDVDFDVMLTEAAPLDSQEQRAGRLNRYGKNENAYGEIVLFTSDKENETTPIYKNLPELTFNELNKFAKKKIIEFPLPIEFQNIDTRKKFSFITHDPRYLSAEPSSTLHTLASPTKYDNVAVSIYLHGLPKENSFAKEVNVAYIDIPKWMHNDPRLTKSIIRWIKHRKVHTDEIVKISQYNLHVIREKDCYTYYGKIQVKDAAHEQTIFIPCFYGQHTQHGWDTSFIGNTPDIHNLVSNNICIPFHKSTIPEHAVSDTSVGIKAFLVAYYKSCKSKRIKRKIKQMLTVECDHVIIKKIGIVIYHRVKYNQSNKKVLLDVHSRNVGNYAKTWGETLRIRPEIVKVLELAGQYHDLGKLDNRFQRVLGNTDETVKYAKSIGKKHVDITYPKGFRHEYQSVAFLKANPQLLKDLPVPYHDLLFQLILASHGRGRPFTDLNYHADDYFKSHVSTFMEEQVHCKQSYDTLDNNIDRFYQLNQQYGVVPVAYLETIIRLADWKESGEAKNG